MSTLDITTRAAFHRGRPALYRGRRRAVTAVRTPVRFGRPTLRRPTGRDLVRWAAITLLAAYLAAVLTLGLLAGTGVG